MDLTPEQIQAIVDIVLEKCKSVFNDIRNSIPKDVITKEALAEVLKSFSTKEDLTDLKNAIATSEAKTNEAVKKIAEETETKIQALRTTPAENKAWYDKELI